MPKSYFEFYPMNRGFDRVVIVTMPSAVPALAKRIVKESGFYLEDYYESMYHTTIESATARDRGCEYSISNIPGGRIFSYKEKQGNISSFNIKYVSMSTYMQYDHKVLQFNGDEYEKAIIYNEEYSKKLLKSWGYSWQEKSNSNEFDGCKCRECKGLYPMAEPDDLKEDGMLTCWTCRDRFKGFGVWENKLKEYKKEDNKL